MWLAHAFWTVPSLVSVLQSDTNVIGIGIVVLIAAILKVLKGQGKLMKALQRQCKQAE